MVHDRLVLSFLQFDSREFHQTFANIALPKLIEDRTLKVRNTGAKQSRWSIFNCILFDCWINLVTASIARLFICRCDNDEVVNTLNLASLFVTTACQSGLYVS